MANKRGKSGKNGGEDGGAGRLEHLTSLQEVLLKEVARKVKIVADGRSQTLTMEEVVTRKLLQIAANGGQHAISNVIYQINQAQRLDRQKREEDVDLGYRVKAYQQSRLDLARKRGEPVDAVLPHPDDIVIDYGVGYRIVGPANEAELKAVKRECAWRDAAILQAALEERLGPPNPETGDAPRKHPVDAAALFAVQALNDALPVRFRLSDVEIALELMRYRGVSKRELLKRTHRKWASLGSPKPRGWRVPPLDRVMWVLERVVPAMRSLCPEIREGHLVRTEAIASRLQRMIDNPS